MHNPFLVGKEEHCWMQYKEVGFTLLEVQFYLWAVSSTETQADDLDHVSLGFFTLCIYISFVLIPKLNVKKRYF